MKNLYTIVFWVVVAASYTHFLFANVRSCDFGDLCFLYTIDKFSQKLLFEEMNGKYKKTLPWLDHENIVEEWTKSEISSIILNKK